MHSSNSSQRSVGVDVGGTFTDFVLQEDDGTLLHHKQPSTPHDPALAVGEGLKHLLAAHKGAQHALRVVHGTTIGLNSILQRKVARIALVVTRGYRDILEIGRAKLDSSYDFHLEKEVPVVSRDLIFELPGRVAADGAVLSRAGAAELEALASSVRAAGVDAVAIVLLNAYLNPALEQAAAQALRDHLPHVLVSCSSEVWPEIREYERCIVTCLNTQILPLMNGYFSRLEAALQQMGPVRLQLTSSSGGMLGLDTARSRPIETIFSGPSSGVTAAALFCTQAGLGSALTFDMGGTSADMAVISGGQVHFTTEARIDTLPLIMPVVDIASIGAGGGSILWVDDYGVLKVGPESAGAHPGPVAYGLGGTQPTVTDCYLVLGLIDPDNFAGGSLSLDVAAARHALGRIAEQAGLESPAHAAEGALKVATATMATELFKNLARKGLEPAGYTVVPFGGAGPTHAVMLAGEAGLAGVIVPQGAATFCAQGAAFADLRRDFVRSMGKSLLLKVADRLWDNWQDMRAAAQAWLDGEGVATRKTVLVYAVDMQYAGQAFPITVEVSADAVHRKDIRAVAQAFHDAHHKVYGFSESDDVVEVISQRLAMTGVLPKTLPRIDMPACSADRPERERAVFHEGVWVTARVVAREHLAAGVNHAGPLVIEQRDTTIWVPSGWRAAAGPMGEIRVERVPHV